LSAVPLGRSLVSRRSPPTNIFGAFRGPTLFQHTQGHLHDHLGDKIRMQLRIRVRAIGCVRRSGVCQGYSIIKNDAYAINDEVRYLKGKLLDQGWARRTLPLADPHSASAILLSETLSFHQFC